MLSFLRIRGLALLEDVSLELAGGLNVLTGETGAGKSIIVGALSLLRGARAKIEMIRDGNDSAEVQAQFVPTGPSRAGIDAVLALHGMEPVDDAEGIVVARSIARSGRARATVSSNLVTQTVLTEIGEALIDICSQHEHHFLTHTSRHLEVLDAWARQDAKLAEHRVGYAAWHASRAALEDLRKRAAEREQRIDYLRFAIDELEAARPGDVDPEALRRRVSLLRNAQRWAQFAREAHSALYDADDAIAARLSSLLERARHGSDSSSHLGLIEEQLATAQVACEEAARAATKFAAELEVDPEELELAEDRLDQLDRLRRKHGVELADLGGRLAQMQAELEQLENADQHLRALEERTQELEASCKRTAAALHDARVAAAGGLSRAVLEELGALHIAKARLEVQIESLPEPGPDGSDRVELMFSANPGEPVAPLRKVASGGELSRVLLALKGALAADDRVATYVFDEVDAGVGGAVAEAIGRRLQQASQHHQVLCVTHLPQIAAFADVHFRVGKHERKGRTVTQVERLGDDERIEELARMLGGAKVTQSARDHAAQLVASARPSKSARSKPSDASARPATARKSTPTARTRPTAKR
jgi:DNA repair protein RecN (Recombination protein N)